MNIAKEMESVEPANPALVLTLDGNDPANVEDMLFITPERALEIVDQLEAYLTKFNLLNPGLDIDQQMFMYSELLIISKLVKSPNELIWFGFKLAKYFNRCRHED